MVCSGCGAHLIDGTPRCPFCRESFVDVKPDINNLSKDSTYKSDLKRRTKARGRNLTAAQRRERKRKKRLRKIRAYTILGLMAAVLAAIIIGIIALFVSIFSDSKEYTTAFFKDNELSIAYDGEVILLSENAVNVKTLKEGDSLSEIINNAGLVKSSEDGETTVFIDNYDAKKKNGTLKVMIEDASDDILTVSDHVNSNIIISEDGEHILFLKNANAKGNQGELWYSNQGEAPVKLADKVDAGRFIIMNDGEKAAYIKNYNYTAKSGDVYMADLENLDEKRIDKEVYELYCSSEDGETIIYSKNYNNDRKSFDVYMGNGEETTRAVTECELSPVVPAEKEYVFVSGNKTDDRFSLYRLEPNEMSFEKIISNMSGMVKISPDGETVVYSKLFENYVGAYYIWQEGETEIMIADDVSYTKNNQIVISDDFETIVYIKSYDENKNGGVLYLYEYDGDPETEPEKIAEDVYSCFVLENKNIVYNKNYSTKSNTAQLYIYDGEEHEINAEINPNFIDVFENNIICLYDYIEKSGGNLFIINEDLEEIKLTTDVNNFYVQENGVILAMRNRNKKSGKFDLYATDEDEESITLLAKDIDGILKY